MKIASSTLALDANHYARSAHTVTERLRVRGADRDAAAGNAAAREAPPPVSLSTAARALADTPAPAAPTAAAAAAEAVDGDPRMQLLRLMIEYWTGQRVRVLSAADLGVAAAAGDPGAGAAPAAGAAAPASGAGIAYDRSEIRAESETTRFAATGVVRTQDGQEIRFRVDVAMTREFREASSITLRIGEPARKQDPLVLNFNGGAAALESARMDFDLDADGDRESVARLARGSAYLVFDRNGNGRADDGSELFGPATGSGFAELAALDGDGNGWIDEADAGWKSLGLWAPATGDALRSLAAAGVGALATGSVGTPFALRGAGNAALGEVRATGVWLAEGGGAGTVQQVDLVV